MTITPLNLGAVANDGNGQDLRSGGQVINANFAELDERTSAASLKAIGAVPPAANTLVYFDGSTTAASAVLTIKARALLTRTDAAGMQAELALVPVASTTDRTAGRLLTPGSGGILGVPVPIPNANNITFLGGTRGVFNGTEAESVAANFPALGGTSTNPRRWFISTDFYDAGSCMQQAVENFGVGTIKGRTFIRVLHTSWQSWVEVLRVGDYGVGAVYMPFIGVSLNPDNYLVSGEYLGQFAMAEWAGPGTPTTNVSGWLTVAPGSNSATSVRQTFTNEANGFTFVRAKVSGAWAAWAKVFNSLNAQQDAQSSLGLMSVTVVGGWTIEKFLNGTLIITGTTVSVQLPANQISTHTFAVPSSINSVEVACLSANMMPRLSNDCSINYNYMSNPSAAHITVRNGVVAQIMDFRIKIIARWKA